MAMVRSLWANRGLINVVEDQAEALLAPGIFPGVIVEYQRRTCCVQPAKGVPVRDRSERQTRALAVCGRLAWRQRDLCPTGSSSKY